MPAKLSAPRRLGIAARWPVGVALTSWRYLWRTTVLHRRERDGSWHEDCGPPLPPGTCMDEIQGVELGVGPLFHRRYQTFVREADVDAAGLMRRLQADPDAASPSEFAAFRKTRGDHGAMRVGDEYVVRMAAPWDGPVRVVAADAHRFRFVTLDGHLEAGQIEFAAADSDGGMTFRIESWARSGDRLAHLLYTHLRMAKEIQFHMWTSFLERVAGLAGGRMTGGVDVETRRVTDVPAAP
jgi:hypothetical protein